jgi:hypothetical protein
MKGMSYAEAAERFAPGTQLMTAHIQRATRLYEDARAMFVYTRVRIPKYRCRVCEALGHRAENCPQQLHADLPKPSRTEEPAR